MANLLIVDIETTGFSKTNDQILELGIVDLNLETGEIKHLFDKVFKSHKLTSNHRKAWIFENGFMTLEEVRQASDIVHSKNEISLIFQNYKNRITAWNRAFDSGFLTANGFALGQNPGCPMIESTDFFKLPKKNPNHKGFKWPSAQEAWDILFPDTPRIEKHRGLDDADMEARIIYELYKRGVYKPIGL